MHCISTQQTIGLLEINHQSTIITHNSRTQQSRLNLDWVITYLLALPFMWLSHDLCWVCSWRQTFHSVRYPVDTYSCLFLPCFIQQYRQCVLSVELKQVFSVSITVNSITLLLTKGVYEIYYYQYFCERDTGCWSIRAENKFIFNMATIIIISSWTFDI